MFTRMSFSILALKGYTSFLGFCLRYTKLLSDDTISIDSFKLNDQFDLMSMYVYYIILVYINTYQYFDDICFPQFTRCFKSTVLVYTPVAVLLLLLPYQLFRFKFSKARSVPWGPR